jgi:glycosyltransferase involved in cell wall biosynthesis
MSVVVYKQGSDPSAFYRLTEPARVTGTEVVERLPHVGSADTVILNRPLDPGIAEQVRLWREEGRTVIVDMDDDFDAVVPEHHIHGMYTTEHLHAACKAASVVTCSTPALITRYGYGHGVLLRNKIPESYLSVTRRSRKPVVGWNETLPPDGTWIGWYGSLGSHPNDPMVAGAAVGAALGTDPDAEFVFAGPPKDGPRLAELFDVPAVRELGLFSMGGLIQVISEFDIGIVPLEHSSFNDAKSWLKGLEFAAVGVPVVASSTPEYRRMARAQMGGRHGPPVCWLASTPPEWERQLTKLIRRPDWRADLAANGKAWAATQTIERAADDWRTVWYSHDHATL